MQWILILGVMTTSTWAYGDPAYHTIKIPVENEEMCRHMLDRAYNSNSGSVMVLWGKCHITPQN